MLGRIYGPCICVVHDARQRGVTLDLHQNKQVVANTKLIIPTALHAGTHRQQCLQKLSTLRSPHTWISNRTEWPPKANMIVPTALAAP